MKIKNQIRRFAQEFLYRLGCYPSRWQLGNPFKLSELTYLVRESDVGHGEKILDFGCGKGIQTQVLSKLASKAIGFDLNEGAIESARILNNFSKSSSNIEFVAGDLLKYPIPLDEFDHVFSISVIEHIDDVDEILKRFIAITKPGGRVHLTVDSLTTIRDQDLIRKHKRAYGVVTYFDVQGLVEKLEGVGFKDIVVRPIFSGDHSREEFTRRIQQGPRYGGGLLWRIRTYRQIMKEDEVAKDPKEGIFLIAHCRKPSEV